ncbi:MAG: tryptophan synthase subunit alpha [Planctomycetes bacterium]|nr:tryptophan synthase subunit alpha [Planctomycetota bacterium]
MQRVYLHRFTTGRNRCAAEPERTGQAIDSVAQNLTKTPICVGFGISTPAHAAQLVQAGADGVIVGSAIVDLVEKNIKNPHHAAKELAQCIKKMKNAL